MLITTYQDPNHIRSIDICRSSLDLTMMMDKIQRSKGSCLHGIIVEDITTFTSTGDFSPENLLVGLFEKYGDGDVFDECNANDQPRRITILKVDEKDRNLDIPKDVYSGSEYIYIIKPDKKRLSNELENGIKHAFGR